MAPCVESGSKPPSGVVQRERDDDQTPGVSADMPVTVQRTWLRGCLDHGDCTTVVGDPLWSKAVSQMLHGIGFAKAELGWWLVPLSARLETRTEESMELAFVWMVFPQTTRCGESNALDGHQLACTGHQCQSPVDRVLSDCKVHGTRKVVNYTVSW